jgi:pilus assembly protein FimV
MANEGANPERRLEEIMSQQIVTRMVVRWVAGVLFALSPLVSHALGLGKFELKSALNQPLDAEIDFTSISDAELKGLKVSLAPRADFEAAGAERLPLLSQIKFIVSKRPDGRHYLQLKTDEPVVEPFLFVVLQVEWAGGRLVREYTALLDPPSYVVGKPAAVASPQTAPTIVAPSAPSPSTVETVPPPTPAKPEGETRLATPAPPAAEPLAASPPPQEVSPRPGETQEVQIPAPTETTQPAIAAQGTDWSSAVEYTVRPGDTLWAIAERIRTDGQLSTEQVILAIFRNNPDAFFRNNVNNVYAGKVLKIPERDAVEATPLTEARREFRAQYSAWKEYKTQLAARGRALKVEPEAAETPAPTPSGSAQSKPTEEKKEAAATTPSKESEELLKIVRSTGEEKQKAGEKSAETESSKATESRERTALAERVATLDESLESKRLENRELSEKVGQVRSQIKNEKRLIQLENQTLAQQTAKPAEPKPEMPKAEAKPEPAPKPEPKTAAPPPPPAKPVKPAPKPRVRATPPPPPEKGLVDTILETVTDGSVLPLVGGVLVLLVGGVLFVYMRRRRRSIAEFEESILASDAIATEATPTSAETTGQVTTGDTSFLSDFSKGGMGQVHTDEVDPVAEAEVYLAYGRDETAEEILKEAIVKNPERHELKQKLLEIYAQRNDVGAFETLAEELYAAVAGRGSKVWEKVEEMGRKLNPDNPMFRGGAPEPRGATPASRAPTEPSPRTIPAAGAFGAAAPTQVVDQSAPVEFEFETEAGSPSAAADTGSIEFGLDTDLPGSSAIDEKPSHGASAAAELDEFKLDTPADNVIDFDASKGNGSDSVSFEVDTVRGGGEDDIKWDLDTQEPAASAPAAASEEKAPGGNGADEQWDETATKLDLAKAYIDMGDAEGARSILDEVLAEGNDAQKKQAAELAAQIA